MSNQMERAKKVSLLTFFLLPILPITGWAFIGLDLGVLVAAIGLVVIWWGLKTGRTGTVFFGYPLLLIVAIWGMVGIFYEWPLYASAISAGWPLKQANLPNGSLEVLNLFLLLLVAAGWYGMLSKERALLDSARWGVLVGGGIALLSSSLLGGAFLFGQEIPLPRQSNIWNELNRPVGTFTDPNAFGIYAALYTVFLLGSKLGIKLQGPLLLLAVIAGGISGSRTFLLFESLFFLVLALQFPNACKHLLQKKALFIILLVVTTAIFLILSGGFKLLPASARVVDTVVALVSGDLSLIMNRLWFSYLSITIFLDNPIVGVGPLAFSKFVLAYADTLNIPLGSWIDNSNNTYLGFLAELGFIGCLALLFTARMTPLQNTILLNAGEKKVFLAGGIALLFTLLLGPHYLFPEVLFLMVGLGAALFPLQFSASPSWRWKGFFVIFLVTATWIIGIGAKSSHYGLYNWEVDERGRHFRWTSGFFSTQKQCAFNDQGVWQVLVTVRNGQPQTVTLDLKGENYRLSPGEERAIPILCKGGEEWLGIHGFVTPLWQPAAAQDAIGTAPQAAQDLRLLGLQLISASRKDEREMLRFDKL